MLWLAGPRPLDTRCYVQCVTATTATIGKVDAAGRALRVRLRVAGGDGEAGAAPVAEQASPAGRFHAVAFTGLRPGTRYTYEAFAGPDAEAPVGGGAFQTAPADDRALVRIAAVGDSGDLPWWFNFHEQGFSHIRPVLAWTHRPRQWDVAEWIAAQRPHAFVHLGDLVYWPKLFDAHGEAFFRPFEPVLREAALFTLAGNHDLPADGSTPPFEQIFRNPADAAARAVGRPQRNFSTAFGALRLIAYDLTDPECLGEARLAWLTAELERATEPWLVVAIHRPVFSVYREEDPALAEKLWPVLDRHGVDLVMSGDDHHYARFERTPDPRHSPMQLIAGGGGKSLYQFEENDPRLRAARRAWSFLVIEAEGLALRVYALGAGGKPLDSIQVDRSRGELPARIRPARRARIMGLRR